MAKIIVGQQPLWYQAGVSMLVAELSKELRPMRRETVRVNHPGITLNCRPSLVGAIGLELICLGCQGSPGCPVS